MDLETELARIAEQERQLRFEHFNEDTAWELGSRLRALAAAGGAAVTIEVRLARETVFFCAMPGTAPVNADWARRKRNTTELLARSSYAVGLSLQRDQSSLQMSMWLPPRDYASMEEAFLSSRRGRAALVQSPSRGCPNVTITCWSSRH